MNYNFFCNLMQAVVCHDTEEVRSLLCQAERQHIPLSSGIYPELPEIIRTHYNHFPQPVKAPFAERAKFSVFVGVSMENLW